MSVELSAKAGAAIPNLSSCVHRLACVAALVHTLWARPVGPWDVVRIHGAGSLFKYSIVGVDPMPRHLPLHVDIPLVVVQHLRLSKGPTQNCT